MKTPTHIGKIGPESVRELALMYYYKNHNGPIKIKDGDTRKIGIKEYEKIHRAVRLQSQFIAYGNALLSIKEIRADLSLSPEQMLNEVQGEVELLLKMVLDAANTMHDVKTINSSLESIKKIFGL